MQSEHELSDSEINYEGTLDEFRSSVDEAFWLLVQAQNVVGGERRHWSSVLFLRIRLICESIFQLCPDRRRYGAASHWDFSSIASLARNLFEAIAFLDYISSPVEEEEFEFRVLLMSLNDCVSRIRVFEQLGNGDEVAAWEGEADRLRGELYTNLYFKTLNPAAQKRSASGFQSSLLTLREMATKMADHPSIWGMYDYLSTHTHSHPMSFFRMVEQGRTGRENVSEKAMLAATIELLTKLISRAANEYREDHGHLVLFKTQSTPFCLLEEKAKLV